MSTFAETNNQIREGMTVKKIVVVAFLVLLGVVGFAVKESAAVELNKCWKLDTAFGNIFNDGPEPNDTIKAFIRFADFDSKKLVTASWALTVCPGCDDGLGNPTDHTGLVLLTGTGQKGVNGKKEMSLVGTLYDETLDTPFGRQCWLHMVFDDNTLNTGKLVGECEQYFDRFNDTFSQIDCSTARNP